MGRGSIRIWRRRYSPSCGCEPERTRSDRSILWLPYILGRLCFFCLALWLLLGVGIDVVLEHEARARLEFGSTMVNEGQGGASFHDFPL